MLASIMKSMSKKKEAVLPTITKHKPTNKKRRAEMSYEDQMDADVTKLREKRERKRRKLEEEKNKPAPVISSELQALRAEFDVSDSDEDEEQDILGDKPLIDTKDKAEAAVKRINEVLGRKGARQTKVIAVDLEWIGDGRDATLCLLQLAVPDDLVYLFDFVTLQASVIWAAGLKEIMESKDILKIFHDCRQDADVLWNGHNVKLTRVYDTQIAFALFQQQQGKRIPLPASLNTLLRKFAFGGVNKHKDEARAEMSSNAMYWAQRPMTESQMGYARQDVLNVPVIYRQFNGAFSQQTIKAVVKNSELYADQVRSLSIEEYTALRDSYDGIPKYNIESWDNSAKQSLEFYSRKK